MGVNVVLVHPQIPHNSGCAGRLTAGLGARLHLVKPLGFSLEDRYLKRAGLDYWPLVDLVVHESLEDCLAELEKDPSPRSVSERLRLFTARTGPSIREVKFARDDVLFFGSETKGLPKELLEEFPQRHVRIPLAEGVRSINLANAIAIGLFTALGAE